MTKGRSAEMARQREKGEVINRSKKSGRREEEDRKPPLRKRRNLHHPLNCSGKKGVE